MAQQTRQTRSPQPGNVPFPPKSLPNRKTPFLALSKRALEQKALEFASFLPDVRTAYSVKANPSPDVLRVLRDSGLGFEVSSLPELRTVLSLGVVADRITVSNPIKTPEFISYSSRKGLKSYVFDSASEAEKISAAAPGSSVIVRIATDNSESAWPLDEKFGVEPEEALALLLHARTLGLHPLGVTFHVGSQCTGLTSWRNALERTAEVWHGAEEQGARLQTINLGGGFPASHTPDVPDVPRIIVFIKSCVAELFPGGATLITEPGRALVADAGALVASVIGKAERQGRRWLYLDLGVFNGLMEAVGGISYNFKPLNGAAGRALEPWTVAGPSCDSFDVLSHDVPLPHLDIGERVMVYPGGAYTTAYASRFNGTTLPRTYLL